MWCFLVCFGLVFLMSELGHLLNFCEPLLFRRILCSSVGLLCPSMTWRKITDHLKLIISNCFCEGLVDVRASFIRFFHFFFFLNIFHLFFPYSE